MHRHGYKGKKFGRERDQREALIKNLADALVINKSIETTLPKAKTVLSYTEKLITKAKQGSLHSRRQVISGLATIEAANMLVDQIAPQLKNRDSGHLRIERTILRRGDNTQMAKIMFVDEIKDERIEKAPTAKPPKAAAPRQPKAKVAAKGIEKK